jgi:outer membrane lipoprotein carrier protein
MMMKRHLVGVMAALSMAVGSAWADGMASLESFVKNVRSGRAQFTQTVTPPAKEGEPARAKVSTGSFEFQRPGKFKFDYRKPFVQLILADGESLWLYDADLNQVTQRKQSQVLGSTPAALIAAAPDLRALQADFKLEAAPERDGLQWVKATPKSKDGQRENPWRPWRSWTASASARCSSSTRSRSIRRCPRACSSSRRPPVPM